MEIKTKLDKRKIERFYNIIFWWSEGADIPNTWCGLTWKTVGGIIILPVMNILTLLVILFSHIYEWLPEFETPYTIVKLSNYIDYKIAPIKNKLDSTYIKYYILGFTLLLGLAAIPFKNIVNSCPIWLQALWVILMCLSVLFIFGVICFGLVWLIIKGISILFKTKLGVKTTTKIEMIWDVFWEKYCPMINWK